MIPDVPPPGERWCRVCHRLESEVELVRYDGNICVPCRRIGVAFEYYWRVWARSRARELAA